MTETQVAQLKESVKLSKSKCISLSDFRAFVDNDEAEAKAFEKKLDLLTAAARTEAAASKGN